MVGAEDDEDYEQAHGVSRPGDEEYRPPSSTGNAGGRVGSFTASGFPTQADELKEVSILSKDASEILWEMVALGEIGERRDDIHSTAQQLQAQLRGLINDYSGSVDDEELLSSALEAFDMISRCLDDQAMQPVAVAQQEKEQEEPAVHVPAPAAAAAPVAAQPVAQPVSQPVAAAPVGEAPLISFD